MNEKAMSADEKIKKKCIHDFNLRGIHSEFGDCDF